MTKTIILACLLLLPAGLYAQSADNAIFFKISGNGLKKPSYILGSFHIIRGEIVSRIPGFKEIYNETPQVCFETDMNHTSSNAEAESLTPSMKSNSKTELTEKDILLPEDSTYDKMIGSVKAAEIDSMMKIVYPMYVSNMRPGYASMIIQMMYSIQMLGITQENMQKEFISIDYYVHAQAVKDGKSVEMLEPFAVQDSILRKMKAEKISLKQQTLADEMNKLYDLCQTYSKKTDQIKKLRLFYEAGKGADVINGLSDEKNTLGLSSGLMDVKGRNIKWMKKISQLIKTKPTLIVVGLAHLLSYKDSEGIISDLRKLGYKVEPIK